MNEKILIKKLFSRNKTITEYLKKKNFKRLKKIRLI